MDAFHERLIVRAATIDELLSDDFEALPGQKADADIAARRLPPGANPPPAGTGRCSARGFAAMDGRPTTF